MIEHILSQYPSKFRQSSLPGNVLLEAKRRVLDSLGCYFGSQNSKSIRILKKTLAKDSRGKSRLWGTNQTAAPETAALLNGAAVRALDYNDTYLSKEPCHPSDMLSSFWAACEISHAKNQGRKLLEAMVLGYEVMVRLCDAASIRKEGWDHVTYLPIATAVGSAHILGLSSDQTRHAIALAATGNNAMRQTRVGTIPDWKAACAAYAARSGLLAARLAQNGFTGPENIFTGRHGFFNQISGPFNLSPRALGPSWGIMKTHIKFYPAEHHAQSAIEAALRVRPSLAGRKISRIIIHCFDAAVQIIGSEKEKWMPTTRETADHSMPYLVAAALVDGDITLRQYEKKRFLGRDIRDLMRKTKVISDSRYSKMYPEALPTRLEIRLLNGDRLRGEVIRPCGYAGRPMTDREVEAKFIRLSSEKLNPRQQDRLKRKVWSLEKLGRLKDFW